MPPSDPPTNDNRGPREPVVLSPRGKQIELAVSIVGLIAMAVFAWRTLDVAHWYWVALVLAVAFAGAFIAAGARWFMGRA